MDKYPVNYNPSLNEFQYSEFANYPHPSSSNVPSAPLPPPNVPIQPINNVYHGYNEYMNPNVHNAPPISQNNINVYGDYQRIDNNLKEYNEHVYVGDRNNHKVLNYNQNVNIGGSSQNDFQSIGQYKTDKQMFGAINPNGSVLLPEVNNIPPSNSASLYNVGHLSATPSYGYNYSPNYSNIPNVGSFYQQNYPQTYTQSYTQPTYVEMPKCPPPEPNFHSLLDDDIDIDLPKPIFETLKQQENIQFTEGEQNKSETSDLLKSEQNLVETVPNVTGTIFHDLKDTIGKTADILGDLQEATASKEDASDYNSLNSQDLASGTVNEEMSVYNSLKSEDPSQIIKDITAVKEEITNNNIITNQDDTRVAQEATLMNEEIMGNNAVKPQDLTRFVQEARANVNEEIGDNNSPKTQDIRCTEEATAVDEEIVDNNTLKHQDLTRCIQEVTASNVNEETTDNRSFNTQVATENLASYIKEETAAKEEILDTRTDYNAVPSENMEYLPQTVVLKEHVEESIIVPTDFYQEIDAKENNIDFKTSFNDNLDEETKIIESEPGKKTVNILEHSDQETDVKEQSESITTEVSKTAEDLKGSENLVILEDSEIDNNETNVNQKTNDSEGDTITNKEFKETTTEQSKEADGSIEQSAEEEEDVDDTIKSNEKASETFENSDDVIIREDNKENGAETFAAGYIGDKTSVNEELDEKRTECPEHSEEFTKLKEDSETESIQDIADSLKQDVEKEEISESCEKTSSSLTNVEEPMTLKEDITNVTSEFVAEEPSVNEEIKVAEVIKTEEKIGFSNDIELDDSELTKMLADLDDDEFKDCETEETLVEEEEPTEKSDEVEKYKVEEIVNSEEQPGVNIEETATNELKMNVTMEEQHKETQDTKEDIKGTIEDKIAESKVETVEKDNRVEAVLEREGSHESRPNDLALDTNEASQDKKRNSINLIGDPGSTPYNNFYVTKAIPKEPKHTNHDSDTECSTSASPTFSDLSTESTSTASTASVDDTDVKDKLKETKKSRKGGGGDGLSKSIESDKVEEVVEQQTESEIPQNTSENVVEVAPAGMSNEEENASSSNLEDLPIGGAAGASNAFTNSVLADKSWLGKEAPLWIPDADAIACLHCDMKFTVIKRRHHCRACGLVLCSKCCNLKMKLEYLDAEARVCTRCHDILNKDINSSSESEMSPEVGNSPAFRPNPNNPLEYCSTVSPLQQMGAGTSSPPSVMVPVGVLKRKGSNKSKSNKSVMFCDGIKPGSDLTNLDNDFNYTHSKPSKKSEVNQDKAPATSVLKINKNVPKIEPETRSFISLNGNSLPPTVTINKTDIAYAECSNTASVVEMLKNETLTFALQMNLYVHVKIINMNCCVNKIAWCFTTEGLINVGNDEIVILMEFIEGESLVPKDLFIHLNNIYLDALKGVSTREMGISLHNASNFLDSKNHAGFVYIRPTFQCLENVIKPNDPFLIGILIHRWETPWAKLFPLRLILRLGAEYRYYPSPIISTRNRDSVFVEVGHTIINLLADFRNFSYTLPQIRGLIIHMEDKKTTVTIPVNRYDLIMKSINNSSDHILAFAGNFSRQADSHLVCIQDTQSNDNSYSTHAINIHNKPRKITGASFIVFNGALKSSSGLTAKSNIVEDGLMIQVPSEHMVLLRDNLKAMKNHTIACGCINAVSDETVNIVWGDNDSSFNTGITSPIDSLTMSGVPSIRVHNGKDYISTSGSRLIRWTEVFILQNTDENSPKNQDPVDISKVSESIAKATTNALVKYIDLLVSNSFYKIAIRANLHVENVSYSAGSNGVKLPPIYMKSLDNELIPVLHRITSNNLGDNVIVLELIFRILNV